MKHIPLNKILAAHIIIFLLLQHLRSSDKGWKRSFWMGFYLVLYSIHVYIYILYVCSIYRSRTPVIQHCPRAAFFITLKWPLPHTASQGVTGSHLLLSSHLTRLLCQKGRKKGTKRGGTTKKHLGCMLNGGFLNGGTLKSSSDWGAPIYGSPRITKFKHMGLDR